MLGLYEAFGENMGYAFDVFNHSVPPANFEGLPLVFHGPFEVITEHLKVYRTLEWNNMKILITPKVLVSDESIEFMDLNE
jgi:hypothetical protein